MNIFYQKETKICKIKIFSCSSYFVPYIFSSLYKEPFLSALSDRFMLKLINFAAYY